MPEQRPELSGASVLPGAADTIEPGGILVEEVPLTAEGGIVLSTPVSAASGRAVRKLGFGFWVAVGWVGLIVLLAVTANLLPIPDPDAVGQANPGLGPSIHHLLGTDDLGRDLFSRVIFGARVSLVVGFFSILFGLVVGGILGMIAGFFRGVMDGLITGAATVLLAFPALVFAIAVIAFWGASLLHVTLAIGILSVAPLTLVVRGNTIRYSEREFVMAARMLGAKNGRIIYRHILANVLPAAISLGLVAVPVAIVAEGALSFLGLSVHLPTPTWGNMIAEGRVILAVHPLVALWPALFLFLTVLALNLAGDRLQRFYNVREGGV